MPRFTAGGRVVSSGVNGQVAIDKHPIGQGGIAVPFDRDRVIWAGPGNGSSWGVQVHDLRTGRTELLRDVAVNFLIGSARRWGGVGEDYVGVPPLPSGTKLALARTDNRGAADHQGTIATTDGSGLGFVLHANDGQETPGAPGVAAYDLTVVGPTQALWPVEGGFDALGLEKPACVAQGRPGRGIRVTVMGEDLIVYDAPGIGLLWHAWGGTQGGIIAPAGTPTFHYDAWSDGHELRVSWSRTAGERPEDIEIVTVDTSARVELRSSAPPPPPVTVERLPRKLWVAPFKSHSFRYGDTPLEQHVGNAIYVEGDDRDNPGRIHSELDRVRPLGWPMIVAADQPIADVNLNTTVAWFVHAADAGELLAKVDRALALPEKPVIAYLDQPRAEAWPSGVAWPRRVWPAVMAYRDPGESLVSMDARVSAALRHAATLAPFIALVPAFYTRNGTVPVADIVASMALYDRWLRAFPIVALLPFADRRPTGMLDHPILRAWARAFLEAVPARPGRFDYWDSGTDVVTVLRNKLEQSNDLVQLSHAEKRFILERIAR